MELRSSLSRDRNRGILHSLGPEVPYGGSEQQGQPTRLLGDDKHDQRVSNRLRRRPRCEVAAWLAGRHTGIELQEKLEGSRPVSLGTISKRTSEEKKGGHDPRPVLFSGRNQENRTR